MGRDQSEVSPEPVVARAMKAPMRIMHWVFVALFLWAVVRLALIRMDAGVLLLFLFPPAAAMVFARKAERAGSRFIAGLFLALIALADFVGPFVPGLDGVFKELPRHQGIVLGWYGVVYLVWLCVLLPPVLFIRPLVDRRRGRATYFSPITCYLGLLLWLIMGPATVFGVVPIVLGMKVK